MFSWPRFMVLQCQSGWYNFPLDEMLYHLQLKGCVLIFSSSLITAEIT